jgi:hypothetical protein
MHKLKRKGNTPHNQIVNFFFGPSYESIAKNSFKELFRTKSMTRVFEGILRILVIDSAFSTLQL